MQYVQMCIKLHWCTNLCNKPYNVNNVQSNVWKDNKGMCATLSLGQEMELGEEITLIYANNVC